MTQKIQFETVQQAKQAAFEMAVRGLASQNWERCFDAKEVCCLWNLGKPGVHCAIGWLIPWENQVDAPTYRQNANMAIYRNLLLPEFNDFHVSRDFVDFLVSMQSAHDYANYKSFSGRKEEFVRLAEQEGLVWPSDVVKE